MLHATPLALFESTATAEVLDDPVNEAWLLIHETLSGPVWLVCLRLYHLALSHFRRRPSRPAEPERVEIEAGSRRQAQQRLLSLISTEGTAQPILVEVAPPADADLPPALADWSKSPPPLAAILDGAGRPPIDGLCLMKAFIAAPLMGVSDDPTSVHNLLHSNPLFARSCGFLGQRAMKQPGEVTSRRLPSLSTCEEFDTVMVGYGLWHRFQIQQIRRNIKDGTVVLGDVLAFDTTHLEANSGCTSVKPEPTAEEPNPKSRKVGRVRKHCDCGADCWEDCDHPWSPTDAGAAVVVKGPTRIYWAHKISVASLGESEIPISAVVLKYAATNDGRTVVPHLEQLTAELPMVVEAVSAAVGDGGGYSAYKETVEDLFGLTLHTPALARKQRKGFTDAYPGLDRITPSGIPICDADHPFVLLGRDLKDERYLWAAPITNGRPACADCSFVGRCLSKGGARRYLRIRREDLPQIDWEHPQHLPTHKATYSLRTGVERAIKLLKVDHRAEWLTHRSVSRVQAHFDRRLLAIHLLLSAGNSS